MGNLYCSIGKDTIIAEHWINGRQRLSSYENSFSSEEELYNIFEKELLDNSEVVNAIFITSATEPAYLLQTSDVPLFQQENENGYLFRTLNSIPSQSIVYKLPDHVNMVSSFDKPVYFIPSLEVFKEKIEQNKSTGTKDRVLFAYLVENCMHLLYYNNEDENKVATIFECEAAADALYYSLLVLKEEGVEVEDVEFIVGGRGLFFEEAMRLLKKYKMHETDFFENENGRQHFDLKGLISCA